MQFSIRETLKLYQSLRNKICLLSFCLFLAVDFFNQINMLYGTITEFCTEESCPLMSAGPKYEYHWADGQTVKKPIKCSAPKYIDYLMTWVQDQLDDETLFPSKIGRHFRRKIYSFEFQIRLLNHTCCILLQNNVISIYISFGDIDLVVRFKIMLHGLSLVLTRLQCSSSFD